MAITGRALHQLLKKPQWTADSWDALLPVSQNVYNLIAEQLNTAYLAPLQGLVREYQTLQQETFDAFYQDAGNPDELAEKMSRLEERVKQLLGEVQ